MIPFSVINTFGNKVLEEKIKKIFTGDQNLYILYKNGNLYALGQNNYGQWGVGVDGSTAINPITLISTNVQDAYDGLNSTVIRKTDGTWWYSGYQRVLGTTTDTTASTSWTSFSAFDYFSTNGLTIKDIQIQGSSIFVLCTNDRLYTMGYNPSGQLCRGGTTLIWSNFGAANGGTNVNSIIVSPRCAYVLKNDGSLTRAGNGLMMGNNGSNITSQYTEISSTYTNTATINLSYSSLMLINPTTKLPDGTGLRQYGQLANSSSDVRYTFYQTSTGLPSDFNTVYNSSGFSYDYAAQQRFVYGSQIYCTGRNDNGQLGIGTTSNAVQFTPMVLPVPVSDVIMIKGNTLATYMLCNGNRLYGCGNFSYLPGYTTNQTTMVPITLPE